MSIIPRDRSNDTYYWHRAAVDFSIASRRHVESLKEPCDQHFTLIGGIQPDTELDFNTLRVFNVKIMNKTPFKLAYAVWKKGSWVQLVLADCNFANPSKILPQVRFQNKIIVVEPTSCSPLVSNAIKEKYREAGIFDEDIIKTLCRVDFILRRPD